MNQQEAVKIFKKAFKVTKSIKLGVTNVLWIKENKNAYNKLIVQIFATKIMIKHYDTSVGIEEQEFDSIETAKLFIESQLHLTVEE